jgi:hypothetical protein
MGPLIAVQKPMAQTKGNIATLYFVLENHVVWAWSEIMALPWLFASKSTNSKHQITNKSQIPIFNTRRKRLRCA